MDGFRKQFYTPRAFVRDLKDILVHMPEFRNTARNGHVNRAFAEKIMLAVTQVNDCRYCARYHTGLALKEGIPAAEIKRILSGEIDDFPEEEAVALAFAQHWAETSGHPDAKAEDRFRDYYGPQASTEILNWMRMIRFGNLAGNALDAILHRLRFWRPQS